MSHRDPPSALQARPVAAAAPERPTLVTARKFLQDFKPIESIVDGLPVPSGGVVSVTGSTGSGKTTLCALLEISLRMGYKFAGREVTQGTVLVLAGENPDDFAMHLLATAQQAGLKPADLGGPVDRTSFAIIPGVFDFLAQLDYIDDALAGTFDNLVAVFVDTSAAFYLGDDENDNVAMRRHAAALRELTTLPGNPTVFVLCHPTKNATRDNLLPRGGGAFLAEVDANLTVWKDDSGIVTLHWAGKIRGAPFEPIRFELVTVELEGHKDCRGRPIFSVAARHLAEERAEQIEATALDDENRLLLAMNKKAGGTLSELATAAGMTTGAGTPNKVKVHRLMMKLAAQDLVKKARTGAWVLTGKGKSTVAELP